MASLKRKRKHSAVPKNKRLYHPPSSSPNLPHEIISEILLKLPLKKLAQFMCVSRSWYSSITHPHFLKLHRQSRLHRQIIITAARPIKVEPAAHGPLVEDPESDWSSEDEEDLESDWRNRDEQLVVSCNGLMLSVLNQRHLLLRNPTTGSCMELPEVDGSTWQDYYSFYGLGFDSSSEGYKVVRGVSFLDCKWKRRNGLQIYSWKKNTWKIFENFPYHVKFEKGVFVDGFLHWLVHEVNSGILSFDLAEEKFQFIPLIENYGDDSYVILHLGALEGLLCVVFSSDVAKVWTVWVMKEYGVKESWTKLMTIPRFMNTFLVEPLCLAEDGKLIMQVHGRKIVKFDPKTKEFETISDTEYDIEATVVSEIFDPPPMAAKRVSL